MKRFDVLLIVVLLATGSIASAQTQSRQNILDEIAAKRDELNKLEKKFLAPSDQDQADFSDLLVQPNTGLIRLLPREVVESEVYKKNQKTLTIRGGGAYYSFTRLTHEYGYGSDIELQQGKLSVGFAGCDYGMLTRLSDIPLTDLSIENPVVASIARYRPPTTEPEARVEQRRFAMGTSFEGVALTERVTAETATTYILRSINYDDSDVLVGLRVVRQDTDGSLIIAWKLLEKFAIPQLARNTNQDN